MDESTVYPIPVVVHREVLKTQRSSMPTIGAYLAETQQVLAGMDESSIEQNVRLLIAAWKQRRQVFIVGNGGSAATASHLANDLSKATILPGKPRIKAIALTDNVSLITAWANDTSYENVFREQLENLLEKEDVVLGISASGNSPNILQAMEYARGRGAVTIGWTGRDGGRLKALVRLAVCAPADDVGMIESCHLVLDHLITTEVLRLISTDGSLENAQNDSAW